MDKRAILLLLLAQFAHAFLGISPNCLHPPCPSPARTSSRSRSSSSSNVMCSLEAPSAAWAASIPPDSGFYRLVTSPTSTSPPKPICYLAESYWEPGEEDEEESFDSSRADYRAFHYQDGSSVSVREVSYHLEGYGHTVWEAGVALSGWVKAYPNLFNERNVVELGSGCGLAGLSAAQVSGALVLTDWGGEEGKEEGMDQPLEILRNLRYNTRVNRLENANVERRDWNDCLPTRGEAQKTYKYDIVMGSDLLYDEGSIAPLFAAITSHMSSKGKLVLMAPSDTNLSRCILNKKLVQLLECVKGASVTVEPLQLEYYESFDALLQAPSEPVIDSGHDAEGHSMSLREGADSVPLSLITFQLAEKE